MIGKIVFHPIKSNQFVDHPKLLSPAFKNRLIKKMSMKHETERKQSYYTINNYLFKLL